MSTVLIDISMSLDGYVTASGSRPDVPMGDGGERLHTWAFGEEDRNRELMANAGALGALIAGRTTYDQSVLWWGADVPTGPARRPLVVVTHEVPTDVPADSVYTFVTGGVEAALVEARRLAGTADVAVMGGAQIAQQFIRAGLVDEISIHVVPVLFGGGKRLFEHLGDQHVVLERPSVVETDSATHLRYRITDKEVD